MASESRPVLDVLSALLGRPEWQSRAACRASGVNFYPGRGAYRALQAAKALCAGCPVRAECQTYAFASDERDGIWGGLSPDQRRKARRGHPELDPSAELADRRG
jgi:WhiB family redox-sensing transcriptional regulator